MFGKKTLMFFENIKVFFQGECYRADTRVRPEFHTYTIEIHPLKPTKKRCSGGFHRCPPGGCGYFQYDSQSTD